ncbi:hypothetical protein BHE74_00054856 [Ensete ventricosum]|nr:hypothetical protein BHE74_00054856 [Ensete ventricosum]
MRTAHDRAIPPGSSCFRHVTTQNRLVTLDFDRRRSLLGYNGRFRSSMIDFEWYQPRERKKKREKKIPEVYTALRPRNPSPAGEESLARSIAHKRFPFWRAISSPCVGRRNVS